MNQPWKNRIIGHGEEAPDQLAANPRNWRIHPKHQQDALAGVIRDVGLVQTVLVNQATGFVVDGHLRVSLALRENQPTIPVTYVDLSEDEEALILATFDPIGALAGTDTAQLDALLREVSTDDAAVQQLLDDVATKAGIVPGVVAGDGGDEFDTTPEEGPTRVQPGELWIIGGKHRLICGDCTDPAVVDRLMGGERAGVVITDPPYAVAYVDKARDMHQRGYGHSRAKSSAAIEGDEIDDEQAEQIWRGAFGVAQEVATYDNAAWYVWHGDKSARLLYAVMAELGFLHHQMIIWAKNNFVIGRLDYQSRHELCFYGWKQGHRPSFYGKKNQATVWEVDRDLNPEHPTQKPIVLYEPGILNHTKAGDILYDCFAGSGPALIAAHRHNRRAYLVELSPARADVILRRADAEGLTVERAE